MSVRPSGRGLLVVLFSALALTSCGVTGPCEPGNPNCVGDHSRLISQVVFTLTNAADATDTVTITASDPDADGVGITFAPVSLALTAGATYNGTIELVDAINDQNLTERIEEEAEEHLFRYSFQPSTAGTVTITDSESDYTVDDKNGGDFDVGLDVTATIASGASGSGTLNVILYRFDDAPKTSSTDVSDEIQLDLAVPVTVN